MITYIITVKGNLI